MGEIARANLEHDFVCLPCNEYYYGLMMVARGSRNT